MITGTFALVPYLWVAFGLALAMGNVFVAVLAPPYLRYLQRFTPHARREWLWYLAATPWLLGLLVVVVTLLPSVSHDQGWALDHCHVHGDVHGHLCWFHPAAFASASAWGACALVFAIIALRALYRLATHLWRYRQNTRTLLSFAQANARGYHRLESDAPSAFTLGLLRPRAMISQALLQSLSPAELDIVLLHERTHVQRCDPLQLWVFRGLTFLLPASTRYRLRRAFSIAVEQDTDDCVARHIPDRTQIASTLIHVQRMTRQQAHAAAINSCAFDGSPLEQRVRHLLENPRGIEVPRKTLSALAITTMTLCALHADPLHHAIEFLLSH